MRIIQVSIVLGLISLGNFYAKHDDKYSYRDPQVFLALKVRYQLALIYDKWKNILSQNDGHVVMAIATKVHKQDVAGTISFRALYRNLSATIPSLHKYPCTCTTLVKSDSIIPELFVYQNLNSILFRGWVYPQKL